MATQVLPGHTTRPRQRVPRARILGRNTIDTFSTFPEPSKGGAARSMTTATDTNTDRRESSSAEESGLRRLGGHSEGFHRQDAVTDALSRAQQHLLSLQHDDGHWCGELAGDSILQSEFILLQHFLGRTHRDATRKAAQQLRRQRLEGSGWAIYDGGPPEVSASVKAYFALKLLGDDPDAAWMVEARKAILELGGIEASNTYTKIYLAMFGQVAWADCPAVPPEMVLLPTWSPIHLYDMSSWSRGIFVPLSIIWACKPVCAVPQRAHLDELHVPGAHAVSPITHDTVEKWAYHWFFTGADAALRHLEAKGFHPLRRRALQAAEQWVTERLAASDGFQGIFPAIVNAIFSYRCLGRSLEDPCVKSQLQALDRHILEDDDGLRVQPCMSPVWDTAQMLHSLLLAGADPAAEPLARAASWLCDKEVRQEGDWRHGLKPRCPVEPSGWFFEYDNAFYPDCDDTAEVLMALAKVAPKDSALAERIRAARSRALPWLLAMQNDDGGWGAFDRNCNKKFLEHVPFADHNAMLDPSWEDITGRVLELLAMDGFGTHDEVVQRAIAFLLKKQEADGTWYGRWGANYIYGTWLVLTGLSKVGFDLSQPRFQRAGDWLRRVQNPDGGFGESFGSYDDPSLKGVGDSTAAQTAWALMALFALGDHGSSEVQRGLDYLIEHQRDGTWHDKPWTGTGFPRVFYLRYFFYDDYFPVMALASYRQAVVTSRARDRLLSGSKTSSRPSSASQRLAS